MMTTNSHCPHQFSFTLSRSRMSTSLFLLFLPPTLSSHSSLKLNCFLRMSPLLTKLPSFPVVHWSEVPNISAWLSRLSWVWLPPDLSDLIAQAPALPQPEPVRFPVLPPHLCPRLAGYLGHSSSCSSSTRHHFLNFSSPACLLTSQISGTCHPYHTH